jgi:hypothetical protein
MNRPPLIVIAGLDPAIHRLAAAWPPDRNMDARVKPGHDDGGGCRTKKIRAFG